MSPDQFELLIKSIKLGNLSKFKEIYNLYMKNKDYNFFKSTNYEKYKDRIEKSYYLALSKFLSSLKFDNFSELFNYSDKLGIFIDVKKIPSRFQIICDLHLDGIQIGRIGRIIDIIRFFNKYNLFEKDFTQEELEIVKEIKKDKMLLENLNDLFGKVSNSLIFYACKIIPYDLYLMYVERVNYLIDTTRRPGLRGTFNLNNLRRWTDRYSMYGLSVANLGDSKSFIKYCKKQYELKKNMQTIKNVHLLKVRYHNRMHLVSINNLLKNYDKIINNKENYRFYSLSMVLLGGLGPQGHGFTYSTPRGELIEVCSDIRENEAIIIKYKQFLKERFLSKMDKELLKKGIDESIIKKLKNYLSDVINNKKRISFFDKDEIINHIYNFLSKSKENSFRVDSELLDLIKEISDAIKIILRPIEMIDQFICRMNLVDENILKSEEIAKLTSLQGKSHYDI
ncbi:MAG: hypothetical protein ACFFHD_02975, partial [Promethearchaeota archaeon]